MAHFAKLDENNIVIGVVVVNNDVLELENEEQSGINFLNNLYGSEANWKQTSYNNNFRKNYAGIGYKYDLSLDAFIPPKPYNSWILDEETCTWQPPIPYPTVEDSSGEIYIWDETTVSWLLLPPSN